MRLAKPFSIYNDIITSENFDKLEKLESFSKERGHSVGELAIAWLLYNSWLGSVIAGAMNFKQLSANVAAADWKLTADEKAEIDKIL
jgi:aryl-alcohol dehydrogenase-like predicted oxidoreductase